MPKPLYGLVCGIPSQMEIIDKHCFGTCKMIIPGIINHPEAKSLMVCRTPKEQCPQLDKQMDEPCGEVMGDPVYIRKLKE
jgi:hypothetical protein